jgi:hypothetical protein
MNGSQSRLGRYGQTQNAQPVAYLLYTLRYSDTLAPLTHFMRFLRYVSQLQVLHTTLIRTALFCAITKQSVVFPYRRFRTTCRSFLDSSPLKMGQTGCPEMSVRSSHYWPRNSQEDRYFHLLRGGSLKSNIYQTQNKQLQKLKFDRM